MKRRENRVCVRLTNSELNHLDEQVYLVGLSREQFLREIIRGTKLKARPKEEWAQLMREIAAIGNNINQIAHQANAVGGATPKDIEFLNICMGGIWQKVKEL